MTNRILKFFQCKVFDVKCHFLCWEDWQYDSWIVIALFYGILSVCVSRGVLATC